MGFLQWYFDLDGGATEAAVLCPFPHKVGGLEYLETVPSAHVNVEKGVLHCKVCGASLGEAQAVARLLGVKPSAAPKLLMQFSKDTFSVSHWDRDTTMTNSIPIADSFNISKAVQEQLHMRSRLEQDMCVPVVMYDKLVDVRTYVPHNVPKVRSRVGATAGLIIPFDLWRMTPKTQWTLICAGEKDMAVARTHDFNAITITGGEAAEPLTLAEFKDRYCAIVYDNDDPGRAGAQKLARTLTKAGATVKVVTNFHEGMEHKEDITDYFNKYSRTRNDLIRCIDTTDIFVPSIEDANIPKVSLAEAATERYVKRIVQSDIQIVAIGDDQYIVPRAMVAEKTAHSEAPGQTMNAGDSLYWDLEDYTCQDILHLMDSNINHVKLKENEKMLLRVPKTERNVALRHYGNATIYKAYVADAFETADDRDKMPAEFQVYCIDTPLESGKKYTLTYKMVPHPYRSMELCMVATEVRQASDSITGFTVTPSIKESLDVFRRVVSEHGLTESMTIFAEKIKGLLNYNGNNQLITTLDLAFHTPLYFNLGKFTNERAYLDTIVVGESRVGKSSTADVLRKTYGLGTFVSLAGNSATIPGLIGGTHKANNSNHTKAGLIPQNHKGLVIFEEFGKCRSDVITELTDVRSSNMVRINRVAGTLVLPATVRMITLSNVKTNGKSIRPIAAYPYGIDVIIELVASAEDIARYDLMLVLSDRGNVVIDPYWQPQEPFPQTAYYDRVRWVWSRTAEQIIINEQVGHYISHKANEMNVLYDGHIKVFGTEAWKKIARLAIAIAGYTVSTDASYENLIVTNEHVDYAVQFMQDLYDNGTFRLKEFVEYERQYSRIDDAGVANLQRIYMLSPVALDFLEREHTVSRATLTMTAGLSSEQVNSVTSQLSAGKFIKLSGTSEIIPTERFRLGMARIDKTAYIRRLGELHA